MLIRFVGALAVMVALWSSSAASAAEVAGVKVDERIKVGGSDLILNGAGLRTKVFIKVYVGALYVTQKATTASALIDASTPRRMNLRLLRDIDADSLFGALRDGLRDNHSEAELAALKPQVDQFAELMKKVGAGKNGDTVAIDFNADGVAISHNGEGRGSVAGAAFGKALLKVWLGENPVDGSLKKALLGS